MARIRSLKPGFFTDADLAELPPLHRILFAGLWCQADKAGRLEDKPRELKVKILPFDRLDVNAALDDLHQAGFILRYTAEKKRLIWIINFLNHQRPHKDEKESELPPPQQSAGNFSGDAALPPHGPGNLDGKAPDPCSLDTGPGFLVAESGPAAAAEVRAADVQAFLDWTKIKRPEELGASIPKDKPASIAVCEALARVLRENGRQKLELAYLAFLGDPHWLGANPPCPIHAFVAESQLPEYLSAAERFLGAQRGAA
jgi:hypothetical protein